LDKPAKSRLRIPRVTAGFSAGRTLEFALILTLSAAAVIGAAAAFGIATNQRLIAIAASVRGDSTTTLEPRRPRTVFFRPSQTAPVGR